LLLKLFCIENIIECPYRDSLLSPFDCFVKLLSGASFDARLAIGGTIPTPQLPLRQEGGYLATSLGVVMLDQIVALGLRVKNGIISTLQLS